MTAFKQQHCVLAQYHAPPVISCSRFSLDFSFLHVLSFSSFNKHGLFSPACLMSAIGLSTSSLYDLQAFRFAVQFYVTLHIASKMIQSHHLYLHSASSTHHAAFTQTWMMAVKNWTAVFTAVIVYLVSISNVQI